MWTATFRSRKEGWAEFTSDNPEQVLKVIAGTVNNNDNLHDDSALVLVSLTKKDSQ